MNSSSPTLREIASTPAKEIGIGEQRIVGFPIRRELTSGREPQAALVTADKIMPLNAQGQSPQGPFSIIDRINRYLKDRSLAPIDTVEVTGATFLSRGLLLVCGHDNNKPFVASLQMNSYTAQSVLWPTGLTSIDAICLHTSHNNKQTALLAIQKAHDKNSSTVTVSSIAIADNEIDITERADVDFWGGETLTGIRRYDGDILYILQEPNDDATYLQWGDSRHISGISIKDVSMGPESIWMLMQDGVLQHIHRSDSAQDRSITFKSDGDEAKSNAPQHFDIDWQQKHIVTAAPSGIRIIDFQGNEIAHNTMPNAYHMNTIKFGPHNQVWAFSKQTGLHIFTPTQISS